LNFSTAKKSYKINFEMIKLTTETKKIASSKNRREEGEYKMGTVTCSVLVGV
jgi:hypothetical protein